MAAYRAAALLVAALAVPAAAQQTTEPQKPASPMTLSGCVAGGQSPQAPVTFADGDSGDRYRLTGRNLRKYTGQRVEIVALLGKPTKVTVKGGLYPSPNVAAQAGAIDPARAAIAAQRGGPELGAGDELPELRVSRVKVLEGSCK